MSKLNSSLYSSKSDDWETPENVLELVRRIGPIALDPCTTNLNPVLASKYYYDNGLVRDWDTGGLIYVNPPYGQIKAWMRRVSEVYDSSDRKAEIVALVPSRTDTKWFSEYVWNKSDAICFWKGRLKFKGALNSAPFPSAIVYYGNRVSMFKKIFSDFGYVANVQYPP